MDSCAAEFVTPPEISSPPIREISIAELHSSTKDRTCSTRGPASPHQIQEMQGVFVMDAKMKKDQIYKITRRAWFWWTREVGCGDQHKVVVKAGHEYATKDWNTRMCEKRSKTTIPEWPPKYTKQSNGAAQRPIKGQIRTMASVSCAHRSTRSFCGTICDDVQRTTQVPCERRAQAIVCGKFCETVP